MFEFLSYFTRIFSYNAERDFYAKHFPSLWMSDEVTLRPMRRSDLSAVSAIERQAYEFPWDPMAFRDCLNVGYCCWVGEKCGVVIAYGILSVGAGESHVLNLCVAPATQGQGYGRKMLEKLIELAREHRAEMIMLEVRPTNRTAIKLYRGMGFNEIGYRTDYYPAKNNGREDALVLAKNL